jgi:DNA-directed RNA polymerase subunit RPC12/RpoP
MASGGETQAVPCPNCGSHEFIIRGAVDYRQPYDGQRNGYGVSEIFWDLDWPYYVECARCERDVTQLFKKREIITQFYQVVPSKGGK